MRAGRLCKERWSISHRLRLRRIARFWLLFLTRWTMQSPGGLTRISGILGFLRAVVLYPEYKYISREPTWTLLARFRRFQASSFKAYQHLHLARRHHDRALVHSTHVRQHQVQGPPLPTSVQHILYTTTQVPLLGRFTSKTHEPSCVSINGPLVARDPADGRVEALVTPLFRHFGSPRAPYSGRFVPV